MLIFEILCIATHTSHPEHVTMIFLTYSEIVCSRTSSTVKATGSDHLNSGSVKGSSPCTKTQANKTLSANCLPYTILLNKT